MIPNNTTKFQAPGGKNTYNALYDTLVELKPTRCLEIGTFHGQSARVFQEYFNEHCPDGQLVTIDIKKYVDLSDCPNVTSIIVHPHVENSTKWHYVKDEELLEYTWRSVKLNIRLIHEVTHGHKFDFCFLDGDHQWESARRDLLIALNELNPPKLILFDDIDLDAHASKDFYEKVIKTDPAWCVYEYENWNSNVGAALIWEAISDVVEN